METQIQTPTPEELQDIEQNPPSPRLRRTSEGEQVNESADILQDIEQNKDVAALSYLWLLSVVVLTARRDSPFVQYHARQGVWLFLLSIPVWIIPYAGRYIEFIVLAGMIIGFLNAAQGQKHDLPIIGQLAKGTMTLRDIWKRIVKSILHTVDTVKRGVVPQKKQEAVRKKDIQGSGVVVQKEATSGQSLDSAPLDATRGERDRWSVASGQTVQPLVASAPVPHPVQTPVPVQPPKPAQTPPSVPLQASLPPRPVSQPVVSPASPPIPPAAPPVKSTQTIDPVRVITSGSEGEKK